MQVDLLRLKGWSVTSSRQLNSQNSRGPDTAPCWSTSPVPRVRRVCRPHALPLLRPVHLRPLPPGLHAAVCRTPSFPQCAQPAARFKGTVTTAAAGPREIVVLVGIFSAGVGGKGAEAASGAGASGAGGGERRCGHGALGKYCECREGRPDGNEAEQHADDVEELGEAAVGVERRKRQRERTQQRGRKKCEHNERSKCKDCGGSCICEHSRQRSGCNDCGGTSICEHSCIRTRSRCKDCGGASICQHNRTRSRCKDCWGTSMMAASASITAPGAGARTAGASASANITVRGAGARSAGESASAIIMFRVDISGLGIY